MRNPCHLIAEPYTFKIDCSSAGIRNDRKFKRRSLKTPSFDKTMSGERRQHAPVAQWQRSRFVIDRSVGSNPPWGSKLVKKAVFRARLGQVGYELRLSDANAAVLMLELPFGAGVGEWLNPADCKSAAVRLRRFESYPLHQSYKRALSVPRREAHIAQR